eukprot:1137815-Pelagomonas_calceolata.AAC.5
MLSCLKFKQNTAWINCLVEHALQQTRLNKHALTCSEPPQPSKHTRACSSMLGNPDDHTHNTQAPTG